MIWHRAAHQCGIVTPRVTKMHVDNRLEQISGVVW
jgi:hypothetical protein